MHQYSEIRDLISCPPSLSKSRLFICNFRFGLHSDPFQYDPKKHLACMEDKSNCSVICTLFKIAFLGKWDERGERPFLFAIHQFPRSPRIILCILSNTVSPPALNCSVGTSLGPVALRMARATSERSGGGKCNCSQFLSLPFPSLFHNSTSLIHLSAICAAAVKFSPVADWMPCRRGRNFPLAFWISVLVGTSAYRFQRSYD